MEEILKFIANNFPGLWSAISCVLTVLEVFVLAVIMVRNRHGKDIDGDGVPDLPSKFNSWFVRIDGKKYYLKDLKFYKEEPDEEK